MIDQDFSFTKIEHAGRLLVPHLLLFGLLVLNVVALPFLPTAALKPQFVLMAVYYWAIYRPTLLPIFFCFIIGLVMDVLSGMPPGIYALVLVTVHWLVREQRRFLMGQPYSTIWAVFGVVSLVSVCVQWALYGLSSAHWSPLLPVLSSGALSLLLFPFVTLLLVVTHRMLPVASRR
ncbi:MAG: rod shape-determining protein MreD [Alphaproteobacteria bacterium CG_4_9_14_3_um_filter_47_13]|nr:MAG: rod shape-determining protein MreD [Alphaproteobacteria bacterium CG_4_9_14_3_um_filter_47_13]